MWHGCCILKEHASAASVQSGTLEIYASVVWASADLALPDSGYSVG